jgi:hypothetical protein
VRKERKEAAKRLYEIAEGQQGFFTTKQAKAAVFAENTHPYHVQAETGFVSIGESIGLPAFREVNGLT